MNLKTVSDTSWPAAGAVSPTLGDHSTPWAAIPGSLGKLRWRQGRIRHGQATGSRTIGLRPRQRSEGGANNPSSRAYRRGSRPHGGDHFLRSPRHADGPHAPGNRQRIAWEGRIERWSCDSLAGLCCRFFIALSAAGVYFVVSRRAAFLVQYPVASGILYGLFVYFFMQLVVIPLSAIGPRPLPVSTAIIGVAIHISGAGYPSP